MIRGTMIQYIDIYEIKKNIQTSEIMFIHLNVLMKSLRIQNIKA